MARKVVGYLPSTMEHLVPEQMFSTEDAPADGVSAVKAIALAAAEGQRIYTITADNVEQALAQINISAATEQEIRNAAYSGKIITTHQHQINFHGWIGEGYIIIDPTTGAGAYKIAGGGNGGFLTALSIILKTFGYYYLFVNFLRLLSGVVGAFVAPIIAVLTGIVAISKNCEDKMAAHLFSGVLVIMALITILLGQFIFTPLAFIVFSFGVIFIKKIIVDLMLNSKLCRG